MQATLNGRLIADSTDVVETGGYVYFPRTAVQMNCLEQAPKTASDLECPHGVQFYDVVIDGARFPRAAWSYEAPGPTMKQVDHRLGFWGDDVKIT